MRAQEILVSSLNWKLFVFNCCFLVGVIKLEMFRRGGDAETRAEKERALLEAPAAEAEMGLEV